MFETYFKEKMAPLTLRLALGLVSAYHGYLKIMASGGTTWYPTMPTLWQVTLAWGEFVGGVAILVGLRCRWAAAAVLGVTLATLVWWQGWNLIHLPLRTLEPHLILSLLGLSLVFLGAGELSLDGRWGGLARSAKRN